MILYSRQPDCMPPVNFVPAREPKERAPQVTAGPILSGSEQLAAFKVVAMVTTPTEPE